MNVATAPLIQQAEALVHEGSRPGLGCQTPVNCVRTLCLHCISLSAFLFVTLDSCHPSHNLVMKHIPGADPELVLLNHYYEELDRIALSDMTRSEINELLEKLGFYKKAQSEDQVPEEFRFSPAKDRDSSDGMTIVKQ
uniref:Selenoprotein M n=1 Tax=Hucho hucho TaxID=62062 RepID=A0A4W5NJ99_9TELE